MMAIVVELVGHGRQWARWGAMLYADQAATVTQLAGKTCSTFYCNLMLLGTGHPSLEHALHMCLMTT